MTEREVSPPTSPNHPLTWQLWGKADPARAAEGRPSWHPLLCHMLDVVACARHLLLHVKQERWAAMASTLSISPEEALPWLLFFVALHDMGKATPGFQSKVETRAACLRGHGLDFPASNQPHGNLSVPLVSNVLEQHGIGRRFARLVARSVGAHHGRFVSLTELQNDVEWNRHIRKEHGGHEALWVTLRHDLESALVQACNISPTLNRPALPPREARNAFVLDLAGLTTAADWLGSNADVFQYVTPPHSALEYYQTVAQPRACDAVSAAGWRRPPASPGRTFRELFDCEPRPLQEAMENILPSLNGPSLIVVEAPMGEGKTEAALNVYDALAAKGGTGLYFALPTQATANQIFKRISKFLGRLWKDEVHGIHLVHGDAGLSDEYEELKKRAFFIVSSIGEPARASPAESVVADAWFASSKRALLAPMGVGTVDQALLGVLGVRHGFLRLHGLAGKVVVIDEVHAYDTYTSELLDVLLRWLRVMGCTVVLLSATLPTARREKLLKTFTNATTTTLEPYPRITVADWVSVRLYKFEPRARSLRVGVEFIREQEIPERLINVMRDGGCVVWIVNTVKKAQATYRALKRLRDAGRFPTNTQLGLLHARYPHAIRSVREKESERYFGPGETERPKSAILVGTQVLEQSLDLDFDLMISELAPIDLILQRAGRLHRHDRKNPRPMPLREPRLWILRPQNEASPTGPTFESSSYIYAEAVLLKTWLVFRPRTELTLPTDIEPLIKAVYDESKERVSGPIGARLTNLERRQTGQQTDESNLALQSVLPPPESEEPFDKVADLKEDDDPTIHSSLRASTRLGDPTVKVVPVVERGGIPHLAFAPHVSLQLDSNERPPRDIVVAVARHAVGIARRDVVEALLKEPVPRTFERSGHLRFYRTLTVDSDGHAFVRGVELNFDPDLGLVIGSLDSQEQADLEICT
ncbi:MAG: CRISPR-associated helicase Cas3' [Polyangiaceae bacterium]|nr:CRISPR-associated helicase Cas3' [Polyangiaceae bacterium]